MTSMDGQRVVVVGGTSGMGLATVRAATALGAEVISAGRRPLDQRAPLTRVHAAVVDITSEASVQAINISLPNSDFPTAIFFISTSPTHGCLPGLLR